MIISCVHLYVVYCYDYNWLLLVLLIQFGDGLSRCQRTKPSNVSNGTGDVSLLHLIWAFVSTTATQRGQRSIQFEDIERRQRCVDDKDLESAWLETFTAALLIQRDLRLKREEDDGFVSSRLLAVIRNLTIVHSADEKCSEILCHWIIHER